LEDSFIDDTDEALQLYLFSTYNRDILSTIDDDDNGDKSDSEGSTSENVPRRVSPYPLRNSRTTSTRTSRNTTNSIEGYVFPLIRNLLNNVTEKRSQKIKIVIRTRLPLLALESRVSKQWQ